MLRAIAIKREKFNKKTQLKYCKRNEKAASEILFQTKWKKGENYLKALKEHL